MSKQFQSQHWKHNNHEVPMQQQLDKLNQVANSEREQRRKFRVEKKLQELNETKEKENNFDEMHYDMVEFANQHFNAHERSPEGEYSYAVSSVTMVARHLL